MDSGRTASVVGREAEVRNVVESISTTGGALIVAEPGAGKSALARKVLAELGGKVRPLWVFGSPGLQQLRFGALAPYLVHGSAGDTGSVLGVMRTLMGHLRRISPERVPVLLVLEDAQDLDEGSALLAAQLVSAGAVRLLALSRPRPAPSPELRSLAADGLVDRFDLAPLGPRQAREAAEAVLGGRLLGGSAELLGELSQGNPRCLLALLECARRTGTLAEHDGVWLLTGAPAPDRRLGDVVRQQLAACTADEREVLETVALGGPLPLDALLAAVPAEAVDSLAGVGLLAIADGPGRLVRIPHPLYREVVGGRVPAGRSRDLFERLMPHLGEDLLGADPPADGLLGEGPARRAGWALDLGIPVPGGRLLRAARTANARFDTALALRAAEAAAEAAADPAASGAARVEAARACLHAGDFTRARGQLAGLLAEEPLSATAAAAAVLEARLALQNGGGAAELRGVAEAWRAAVERLGDPGGAAPAGAHLPAGPRLLSLYAATADQTAPEIEAELRILLRQVRHSPEAELVAKTLLGHILTVSGRCEAGALLLREALESVWLRRGPLLEYCETVLGSLSRALIRCGRFEELEGILAVYSRSGVRARIHFAGLVELIRALMDLQRGQLGDGLQRLSAAVEGLQVLDLEQVLPLALAIGAYAEALSGSAEKADGYLTRAGSLSYGAPPQLQLLVRGYAAAARMIRQHSTGQQSTGQVVPPAAELEALAAEAGGRGLFAIEADLRLAAVRVGDLGQLERLAELTQRCEGVPARKLHIMAQALLELDAEPLLRLGDERYLRLAAACLQRAERLPGGLRRQQLGQRKLLKSLLGSLHPGPAETVDVVGAEPGPGPAAPAAIPAALDTAPAAPNTAPAAPEPADQRQRGPAAGEAGTAPVAGVVPGVRLTDRERVIGTLVVQGRRNAEIARELGLSSRTVEGHIYRLFNKVGIARREELQQAHLGGTAPVSAPAALIDGESGPPT